MSRYITIGALCVALGALTWGAVQTVRLNSCADKKEAVETCEEVRQIEKDIRNETDDSLIDRLSNFGMR